MSWPESHPPGGCIAVVNAGSSSIKFAIYQAIRGEEELLYRGQIEQLGVSPHLHVVGATGDVVDDRSWAADEMDHRAATQEILTTAARLARGMPVVGVGHRVAHGGTVHAAPVRIDAKVLSYLATLSPLAPLHQPHNLAAIEAIAEAAPRIRQVACFDTAFHRSLPPLAQMMALPRELMDAGVRRYGFHGISYEYIASRLAELAPELIDGRVVIAHLGNGASLCALERGRSVACTMGFTAVDGLVMGTRCGTLDPGVLLHLMDAYGMGAREIETLIYRKSGLLGVSGVSSDMRRLRESTDPRAKEAIDLFVYRIVREIGSAAAAMGGLDGLVFTGGIGEHDASTRAEVGKGCAWLGLALDPGLNERGAGRINSAVSHVSSWVIPTDEERMVARHTAALLEHAPA
jgi:acetate kinase